jgi:hypothetical protein
VTPNQFQQKVQINNYFKSKSHSKQAPFNEQLEEESRVMALCS